MKISNKLRKRILNEINAATMELLDEHCPSHKETPPDAWPEHEVRMWDILNELDHRACRKVDNAICSS